MFNDNFLPNVTRPLRFIWFCRHGADNTQIPYVIQLYAISYFNWQFPSQYHIIFEDFSSQFPLYDNFPCWMTFFWWTFSCVESQFFWFFYRFDLRCRHGTDITPVPMLHDATQCSILIDNFSCWTTISYVIWEIPLQLFFQM